MSTEKKYYVYRFLGREDEILYVGRTGDLRSRIKSHFNEKYD